MPIIIAAITFYFVQVMPVTEVMQSEANDVDQVQVEQTEQQVITIVKDIIVK